MTKNELTIAEMNEVIAVFMGMERKQDKDDLGFEWEWVPTIADTNWCFYEPPPFDRSWSWLMPVWIKFRNLMHDKKLFNKNNNWIASLEWYLLSSDQPKRFFERIYYAITWFNQQHKTNDTTTG